MALTVTWVTFLLVGFAGFGIGVGLVAGLFVVRRIRHYSNGH